MHRLMLYVTCGATLACGRGEPASDTRGAASGPSAEVPARPPAAVVHTYDLALSSVGGAPRATVSIELPQTWTDAVGTDGAPVFSAPGLTGMAFGLTAAPTDDIAGSARIEQAFKWQYEHGDGVIREALPGGRLWAVRLEGRITHARVFLPVDGGVVMAVAMLRELTPAKLAEVKATFATLRAGTR